MQGLYQHELFLSFPQEFNTFLVVADNHRAVHPVTLPLGLYFEVLGALFELVKP
jgi:hypothetical protein